MDSFLLGLILRIYMIMVDVVLIRSFLFLFLFNIRSKHFQFIMVNKYLSKVEQPTTYIKLSKINWRCEQNE